MYKAIAMWSGPRNISTAMMYAFASRADCTAWDEPFYAWYLCETKLDHPLGQAVIEAGETNAKKVIEQCCATGDRFVYQKHMSQHMLENLDRSWIGQLNNAFLIREPDQVLASYAKKRAEVTLAEIGYLQQLEIFKLVADQSGAMPPVVDSRKFLRSPETGLRELCAALGIAFDPAMLSWPAGPKPCDGVWAPHWYNAAWQSTAFARPQEGKKIALPADLQKIADGAWPIYHELRQYAL